MGMVIYQENLNVDLLEGVECFLRIMNLLSVS